MAELIMCSRTARFGQGSRLYCTLLFARSPPEPSPGKETKILLVPQNPNRSPESTPVRVFPDAQDDIRHLLLAR
jgi:hypothetical protein